MKHLYTRESLHSSYTSVTSRLVHDLVCSLFSIAPTSGLDASCVEDGTVRVQKGFMHATNNALFVKGIVASTSCDKKTSIIVEVYKHAFSAA